MKKTSWMFLLIFLCQIKAQDINKYLNIIQQGGAKEVRKMLPELISRYPNDPGVLYLKALTTLEGESALEQYQELVVKYPGSDYADQLQWSR